MRTAWSMVLGVGLGAGLAGLGTGSAVAAPVDLFLLAGQSNMVGGAPIGDLDPRYAPPREDVLYSYRLGTGAGTNESDGFGALRHLHGTGVGASYGPELGFGHTLADAMPDRRFALAKFAVNGSSLANRWGPDDNDLYPDFIDFARRQIATLEADGHEVRVRGLVWVQGSGDAYADLAVNYAANLAALVGAVRSDLGLGDLAVLLTQEHADSGRPAVDEIRAQKQAFVDADGNAWMVNIDDYPLRDPVHFAGETTIVAGNRLAQAWLSIPTPSGVAAAGLAMVWATRRQR